MKTITIHGPKKDITIAYVPEQRVTRKQISDLLDVFIATERNYSVYCRLLKLRSRLIDMDDTLANNAAMVGALKAMYSAA